MALINCPECNQTVSDSAKMCPHCGFPISEATNDMIRIKVDKHPDYKEEYGVCIKDVKTGKILADMYAGSIAEIKSNEDIEINIYGMASTKPMLTTTVSPKNGGKYLATWGIGFWGPKITSCSSVDVIDA